MARDKKFAPNIDNSSPLVYPNGRIQDNTGSGNGTPVNNYVYSDLHDFIFMGCHFDLGISVLLDLQKKELR